METTQHNSDNQKDMELWRTAKKRAGFKWGLLSYLLVNSMMIIIWVLGDRGHFWPAWCMFGWGIGLVFQYIDAYHRRRGIFSVDKEYEKLKNQ
jgi:hypothetical protein